jgi:hypothetical protein
MVAACRMTAVLAVVLACSACSPGHLVEAARMGV